MDTCGACGQPFESRLFNARSPDEPPSLVIFCLLCSVNTLKLPSREKLAQNHSNSSMTCEIILEKHIPTRRCVEVGYRRILLGIMSERDMDAAIEVRSGAIRANIEETYTKAYATYIGDELSYWKEIRRVEVAYRVYLVDLISLIAEEDLPRDQLPLRGRCINITESISGKRLHILKLPTGRLEVTLGCGDDALIMDNISTMVRLIGLPSSLRTLLPETVVSNIYTSAAKAIDHSGTLPIGSFKFTAKIDGERYVMVRIGSCWFYCRFRMSFPIIAWKPASTYASMQSYGPILDTEIVLGHPPVLIDVLYGTKDLQIDIVRGIPDLLRYIDELLCSEDARKLPSLYIREYFDTEDDAKAYSESIDLPTDGVIAISRHSSLKLKQTKSVELAVGDNNLLLSGDSVEILSSSTPLAYNIGTIVEIRFRKSDDDNIPLFEAPFKRKDKTIANPSDVCKDIFYKAMQSDAEGDLVRRSIWQWCNALRKKIFSIASSRGARGSIIADVGCGDGQAIESYDNSGYKFLLIEPNTDSLRKMSMRLSRDSTMTYSSSTSLISAFNTFASSPRYKYMLCAKSMEDIISELVASNKLRQLFRLHICCFVYSFSLSHTLPTFLKLAEDLYPAIACAYFYDDIHIGSSLAVPSIDMRRISTSKMIIKLGRDREYEEPILLTSNIPPSIKIQPGSNYILIPPGEQNRYINLVCSHIRVLASLQVVI